MATLKENLKFRDECISEYLLDHAIEFIQQNMSPEDVFRHEQLTDWADVHYECNCDD